MICQHSTKGMLLAVGIGLSLLRALSGVPQQARPCCFVRVGYSGTCVVQPGQGETCESILKYLNTPGTVGKTYCGATVLRGGWSLADCDGGDDSMELRK